MLRGYYSKEKEYDIRGRKEGRENNGGRGRVRESLIEERSR